MTPAHKPVVLVVLDGWGIGTEGEHNGVHLAQTPNFDRLAKEYPFTELNASGEAVGLPDGQMGNSEVGHTTIGAGCIIYQDLVRISKDAINGDFLHNKAMQEAFTHTKDNNSQLHVMGLLSSGGVHSHEDHLIEVIRAAKQSGVSKIVVHPFLDGRDSSPTGGKVSLEKLSNQCELLADDQTSIHIATISGRYYAMDRDTNWDRTDKAFNAIWHGQADHTIPESAIIHETIQQFYDSETFDEHLEPMVVIPKHTVQPNDAVIFTNFRSDRARQLSQKISDIIEQQNLCFVTMTDYGKDITSVVAYEPATIEATIASVVADAELTQAHIAETEKYPHATYFLNGGKQDPHAKEEHVLIPSRKDVKTHDEAPEMMAQEICDATIDRLTTNDFIFVNFANADMVGHTAKKEAIITAVETVDRELGRLAEEVIKRDGVLLVIADHGNAEQMVQDDGSPHTAHTTNIVPCILISQKHNHLTLRKEGGLSDVAPTVLYLLGLKKPACMTGSTLVTD